MTKVLRLITLLLICLVIISGCNISTKVDLHIDKKNNKNNERLDITENSIFYVEPYDGYIKYTYYDRTNSIVEKINIGYEDIKKEDLLTLSSSGNYILTQKNMGKGIDKLISLDNLKSYILKSSGYQIIAEDNESILLQRFNHNKKQWTLEIFNKFNATISESVFYKDINETGSEMNEGVSLGNNQFIFLFREADGTYLAYVNDKNVIYEKISDDIMRDIKILANEENKAVIYKGYRENGLKSFSEPKILFVTYNIKKNQLKASIDKIVNIKDKNNELNGSDCLEAVLNKDGSYSMLFKYKGNGTIKVFKINPFGDLIEKDSMNNFNIKVANVVNNGFYCFDGKELVFLSK
ncbi:hypothetical protein [Caldisalinibacter kiritimatiensis]|uniref:Lipoprotein n=1 Tax=Caldisalinibacter kiritimatiensis TaxID=1304284 RepID=R1ASX2_9FIRM|nr:hypothetical protein [Caldisalinibacter kiritimatiensis]EOD00248.1 hypothetical protein L21TH_1722 [Caldisalinibacter kiritimatiensis]